MISHGTGIIKLDPNTGKYKQLKRDFSNIDKTLADDWSFQIIEDSKGYFWIATPSGLSRLNPEDEAFTNYYHDPDDTASLCNNYINVLFEDSYHNLWIGTNFGLDLFDREKNIFIHFYEEDGLPSNQIKEILENRAGELWISTGYGLTRMYYEYNPENNKIVSSFRNYNKYDNIQDDFFSNRSGCKLRDGNLAIGGENGIIIFDPDNIIENTSVPEVYITGFKLFNKPVEIGEYDYVLKRNIINTEEIFLKHNQDFFSFEFVAMNYISRAKNQFKYMMEGFDENWIDIGNKREASYTNLDPGEYIFRVIASNNDGKWNYEGASIRITISPPFWGTWLFRILVVLILSSLVAGYYYQRFRDFKNQKLLLEKRVAERTSELVKLNAKLTDKNIKISAQNDEITLQSEEIKVKGKEILRQKEKLEEQKNEIEKAYEELKIYRTQLEELVENRTRELIAAKEKAEESDRLKTSFLTNMSHEIRTPLNSIVGFSGLLYDDDVTDEERERYKHIIEANTNTLLSLINDILDFAKIEAGHLEINMNNVPLSGIFDELMDIYSMEIGKIQTNNDKDIQFRVNIDSKLKDVFLLTDEVRLKQVLSILVNNAIKFTHKGYIEVGCRKQSNTEFIEFYVKDTGIGIKNEHIQVIFTRFRKIEEDSSNLYRGAGLGLSITKHLVKLLGGKIWVESEIGKGSVFSFTIPLKIGNTIPKSAGDIKIDQKGVPQFKNVPILVAEDDITNYYYIERLLKKTGATIYHAATGKQVINIMKEVPEIKLILMDIKMPELNGIDALKELRHLDINVPIVAQTAYAFAYEVHKIKASGFVDYLVKPINPKKFYGVLKKHISVS